jgi:hypothetical protein
MSPLLETNSTNLTNFATFFSTVSAQNYPALKESSQKWKDLVPKPDTKKPEEADGKMVVQCSERHDYGKCSPFYHLGAN